LTIPFLSCSVLNANWTGNYTLWGLQPNNITVSMSQCCNITTANITHLNGTINMTLGFNTSNPNCPALAGNITALEIPFSHGLLVYDPLVLNGLIGVYMLTNNTIALSSGYGNCVWIMGNNNNSKITNISAYAFNWGGSWSLASSYGIFPQISTCCTPQFPLNIRYDSKSQTVNYTISYPNLPNTTNSTNGTNATNLTALANMTTANLSSYFNGTLPQDLLNCPVSYWGYNYSLNLSILGGSFFDNTSLFVAFSLSNGSILVQSQSCFLILNQYCARICYNFIPFLIAILYIFIHQ